MRRRKTYFLAVLVAIAPLMGIAMPAPAKDGDAFDHRHDLRFLCCHSAVCTERR
jgi:hypothetical protein